MAPGPGARLAAQFAAVGPPPTLDSSWCHSYAVSHANRHPLPLPGPPTARSARERELGNFTTEPTGAADCMAGAACFRNAGASRWMRRRGRDRTRSRSG